MDQPEAAQDEQPPTGGVLSSLSTNSTNKKRGSDESTMSSSSSSLSTNPLKKRAVECVAPGGDGGGGGESSGSSGSSGLSAPASATPFVETFYGVPIEELSAFLDDFEQPFEKSQLYSSKTETKFVDEELRSSQFRAIVDSKLFDIVDGLITSLTAEHQDMAFSLRRSDITHIKYGEGGFFKRHQVSSASPMLASRTSLGQN